MKFDHDYHDSFAGQFGGKPDGGSRRLSKAVHARLDRLASQIKWCRKQLGGYYSAPAEFTGTPEQRENIEYDLKKALAETDMLYSGVAIEAARTQAEALPR